MSAPKDGIGAVQTAMEKRKGKKGKLVDYASTWLQQVTGKRSVIRQFEVLYRNYVNFSYIIRIA